jgi:NADPH-dependent ferric siderophore reductase
VRAHRPAQAQVDVDFFLHGDLGRASVWAARAAPGDRVGFAGPRTHWERNGGADWSLLVADETGLPALLAILETLPAGHRAVALAIVMSEAEHQQVDTRADAQLHWLRRDELAGTMRELELPWGRGHVWGGGESRAMRTVRDRLRGRPEVKTMQVLGYWSRARGAGR